MKTGIMNGRRFTVIIVIGILWALRNVIRFTVETKVAERNTKKLIKLSEDLENMYVSQQ